MSGNGMVPGTVERYETSYKHTKEFIGFAFSDLKDLKQEHLVRDSNGDLWIRKRRQKTKNMCNILLLDPARQILERYKDYQECVAKDVLLPMLCNHKLKELAAI